jgi:phosphoserine aminotransferase
MLVLSPRAIARLESWSPPWPMPKVFRLTKGGKVNEAIFKGETINTPSMLCVEDYRDALAWADSVGGLQGLIARSEGNLAAIAAWVARTPWIDFLAARLETRSCTSVCLRIVDPWFVGLSVETQTAVSKQVAERLDKEGVAYDIASYRDAPPGLRIWAGATIERSDLEALFPWIEWAYAQVRDDANKSAA